MSPKELSSGIDKETSVVSVVGVERTQTSESSSSPIQKEVWEPGFWKRFPWLGILSLLGVLMCSVLVAVILYTAADKSVSEWSSKATPNVLMSVINGISGILFGVAISNAVAIVWWRKALKGSTIKYLHDSWSFTTSVKDIVLKWRYFNAAALAALVAKLSIVDGTLFQKSLTTEAALGKPFPYDVPAYPADSPTFPPTGTVTDSSTNSTAGYWGPFTDDMASWFESTGNAITVNGFDQCAGICYTEYTGIGFALNCTNSSESVDIIGDLKYRNGGTVDPGTVHDLFYTNFTPHSGGSGNGYAWIELNTLSYGQPDSDFNPKNMTCPAKVTTHHCELRPAIIKYPVTLLSSDTQTTAGVNQTDSSVRVSFGHVDMQTGMQEYPGDYEASMQQVPGFEFVKYIDFIDEPDSNGNNRLGGIAKALAAYYIGQATFTSYSNGTGADGVSWDSNTASGIFVATNQDTYTNDYTMDSEGDCPFQFFDPLQPIVTGINLLTFIAANDPINRDPYLGYDNMTNAEKMISGHALKVESHYRTNYAYVGGALAATVVCVLLVLPAFWGFWELGRKATLSPIEIANAFNAPALGSHNGNGHADAVLRSAGKQRVRYAEVEDEETGRTYRMQ